MPTNLNIFDLNHLNLKIVTVHSLVRLNCIIVHTSFAILSFQRSGLVKLRGVLRAIHKHFPQPPNDIVSSNAIDKFLDGPDSCEKKLLEIYESNGGREAIMNILFPDGQRSEALEKLSCSRFDP
jgi:hypothetical protein